MSLEETKQIEVDEGEEITLKNIDSFLDRERAHNKTESWVKLDKNVKRQVLHSYAEKYGKEYNMPVKEIKVLKSFFNTCLEKNKLNRTKDVVYNRDTQIISSIPGLFFNKNSKNYTIRANDSKRVSTLKSLAPKKKTNEENI